MQNIGAARGTRDFLPGELMQRERVFDTIKHIFCRHGFLQIETPAFENIEVMQSAGTDGENQKLSYSILRRGLDLNNLGSISAVEDLCDLALRYDLTVPLMRFFVSHQNLPHPFKSFHAGYVWRAERPQKGRYRQFMQCDIDICGDQSPYAEAQILQAAGEAFLALGLGKIKIHYNHRSILNAILHTCGFARQDFAGVLTLLDKVDKLSLDAVLEKVQLSFGRPADALRAVLRQIDTALETMDGTQRSIFTHILPHTLLKTPECQQAVDYLQKVISLVAKPLKEYGVEPVFDPYLVRGMGYYTGCLFEAKIAEQDLSIGGGGRYSFALGKQGVATSACGFSIGFERVVDLLRERRDETPSRSLIVLVPGDFTDELVFFIKQVFLYPKKYGFMHAPESLCDIETLPQDLAKAIEWERVDVIRVGKNLKDILNRAKDAGFGYFCNVQLAALGDVNFDCYFKKLKSDI